MMLKIAMNRVEYAVPLLQVLSMEKSVTFTFFGSKLATVRFIQQLEYNLRWKVNLINGVRQ